ncbi:MAG: hypothetical protein CMJ72_07860 [Planctomycetaceae bacterium]|nr:hypothetical protein [Planctomycetaceae bacterium]HCK41457.1 hypothetical protein [Planctomycetaceae bacterium]
MVNLLESKEGPLYYSQGNSGKGGRQISALGWSSHRFWLACIFHAILLQQSGSCRSVSKTRLRPSLSWKRQLSCSATTSL